MLRTAYRSILLGLLALAALAAPAAAAPVVSGEFPVPEIGANNKLVEGPEGNMWLTVSEAGKDVAKVTPAGVVTSYDLQAVTASGIAVGPEKRIWITRNGGVTSFDPADPEATKAPTSISEIGTFHSIALGPDGNLWVATDGKVLRIPPADPSKFTVFPVPNLSPRDIDAAGSLLAIADSGGEPRIVTMTTLGVPTAYKLPGGSQGVAGAPDGTIAFSQQGNAPEQVGLIQPPTLSPLIETPGGGGDPFGAARGVDGDFWLAMSANDGLARLTPGGNLTLLGGFSKGSFPRQLAPGPNNTLWVTLDLTEKIGRVSGLEPPAPPPPTTKPVAKIAKGPKGVVKTGKKRAKVAFRFSSTDAAATFQCRLLSLPPKGATKKGGKAASSAAKIRVPAFKGCKSPRRYKLKPGRYRFQVRAVNAAGAGKPAKRTFRVVRVAG